MLAETILCLECSISSDMTNNLVQKWLVS